MERAFVAGLSRCAPPREAKSEEAHAEQRHGSWVRDRRADGWRRVGEAAGLDEHSRFQLVIADIGDDQGKCSGALQSGIRCTSVLELL